MFWKNCMRCALKLFAVCVFVVLILAIIPGIPPKNAKFPIKTKTPPQPREGVLKENTFLNDAERLLEGKILCPESMIIRDDEMYAGLEDGVIVKFNLPDVNRFDVVVKLGKHCVEPRKDDVGCSRPLGLRFGNDGRLFVADGYLGILAVDVKTGKFESIVDISKPIAGKMPRLSNALDIDENGIIYWSDSTTTIRSNEALLGVLATMEGRLIASNPKTGTHRELITDLELANGVQLSSSQDYVLVSESMMNRVVRYWLKGPKRGTTDVFIDGLPGNPDNFRPVKGGGYYLSLFSVDPPGQFDLMSFIGNQPTLRKVIARFFGLIRLSFDTITRIYPNELTARLSFNIFDITFLVPKLSGGRTMVLQLDEDGGIIRCLEGTDKSVIVISETIQHGDYLYFGSPINHYLGRIKVPVDSSIGENTSGSNSKHAKKTEL